MMKTKFKILALFFITVSTCIAQEENDTFSTPLSTQQNTLWSLSKLSEANNIETISPKIQNQVFIAQIGDNNFINTNIKSSFSTINLSQKGTKNQIFLDKSALQLNQFIAQDGFNNSVIDLNFNSNASINSNYTQTGNNLNLISIGTNSISKEMTIKQKGSLDTIIVLSK